MQSSRYSISVLCFVLAMMILAPLGVSAEGESGSQPFNFAAIADIPYDPVQEAKLKAGIERINADPSIDFVIHLGDIKAGASPCDEAVYEKVSGMLKASTKPVFIILGDNEWNDCGGGKDPAHIGEVWGFWTNRYLRFDQNWKHSIAVQYQEGQPENFAFVHNGVLFLGLNMPGSQIFPGLEKIWSDRLQKNVEWIQKNFAENGKTVSSVVVFGHCIPPGNHLPVFDEIRAEAKKFPGKVLYLYGDGHTWHDPRPDPAAPNFFICQLDGGAKPRWLTKITVTPQGDMPFEFSR
jgi:hypothetical protein